MDDVLYLVHTTNKYTNGWKELSAAKIENYKDQFPGVFLTLITKQNINKVQLFLDNTQILIFSKRLLEQKNYHINLRDYNGFISETNTYFPWNLKAAVKKINNHTHIIGNEVVFHDLIPIDYLCLVINNLSPIKFNNTISSNNRVLPNIPIQNNTKPDMTKEPFYCYPLEKSYGGIDPFQKVPEIFL